MNNKAKRDILIFVVSTFIWSAIVGGVIYLMQLSVHSSEARTLMAFLYMPSPAVAALMLHRWQWKELVSSYGLNPKKVNWKHVIITSVTYFTCLFIILLSLTYLLGNILHLTGVGELSFSTQQMMSEFKRVVPEVAQNRQPTFSPLPDLLLSTYVSALLAGSTINMLFALGEEIGWRGFLWSKLKLLGFLKANIVLGTLWGLWHTPIIIQGYNYPGQPVLGILFMILFAIALSFPLTDFRERTKSVYTPAILHGMINATGIFTFVIINDNQFIGGMLGFIGFISLILAWLLSKKLLDTIKQ